MRRTTEFAELFDRNNQSQLEASGKNDLLVFILAFLSSPWYIKNPFLKAKLVQVSCYLPLHILITDHCGPR